MWSKRKTNHHCTAFRCDFTRNIFYVMGSVAVSGNLEVEISESGLKNTKFLLFMRYEIAPE